MSNTITITCTQDTYLDSGATNTDFSGATLLKSRRWYPGDTPSHIPILQFNIPTAVKYSKILSAKVNYTIQQVDAIDTISGTHIRAFSASSIVAPSIRYNNYPTYGTFTEPAVIDYKVILSTISGSGYSSTHYASDDVTALLQNNIINDIFTIAINLRCNYYDTRIRGYGSAAAVTLTIEYENVFPDAPTLLYPVDVYLNQDSAITLKWVYNTESGAKQLKFELDWKKSTDSVWITLISQNGADSTYTVPAKSFPIGQIDWRCRTTDELSQLSDYSQESFIVKGKPAAPIVTTIINNALTTISWNANGQVAREIELISNGKVIDYSKKSSADNMYLPELFLQDGTYEFRIRIQNAYNMWSDYTSRIFTISTTKPTKGILSVSLNENETTIVANSAGYLYRREGSVDTLIHIFGDGGTYIDKGIKHGVRTGYYLRNYNVGYTDSVVSYVSATIKGFIVSNKNISVNLQKSTDNFMPYVEKVGKSSVLSNYSGRKHPVIEFGEFERLEVNRSCYIDEQQYEDLLSIYFDTQPITYRDNRGRRFECNMSNPNIVNVFLDKGYSIELTFTKIDSEGVAIR